MSMFISSPHWYMRFCRPQQSVPCYYNQFLPSNANIVILHRHSRLGMPADKETAEGSIRGNTYLQVQATAKVSERGGIWVEFCVVSLSFFIFQKKLPQCTLLSEEQQFLPLNSWFVWIYCLKTFAVGGKESDVWSSIFFKKVSPPACCFSRGFFSS